MMKPVTVDFETHGIEKRPDYPPRPIGVAIKYPGQKSKYWAFGHMTANNCGWGDAEAEIRKAWQWSGGLLFHNSKFDVDVAETFFGVCRLNWARYHDTLFLVFLDDPNQQELGLKPSAKRLLGMDPVEREAVADWLIEHQPVPGVRISKSTASDHYFMKYLAWAPGVMVGEYGEGDVVRTEKLYDLLMPKTVKRSMLEAYDRERRLMPCLLDAERRGVPVDAKRLHNDVMSYTGQMLRLDGWIRRQLGARSLNVDSGDQLADALIRSGKACEELFPRTEKTHKIQTNKAALEQAVTDKRMLAILKYRTQLATCLNTFMAPWLVTAEKSGGLIYTTWNQVKTYGERGNVGARTGRLSSTPNFQNIPKEFMPLFSTHAKLMGMEELMKSLPPSPFDNLPLLPHIRGYVTPFPGEVLLDRDYSQQELRILAHFIGGFMLDRYKADPWMDMHDFAMEELHKVGLMYSRKPVKNTNFALVYGMGYGALAEKNGTTVEEAKALKTAVLALYPPELKLMYKEMKRRSKAGEPFRTWGGREYYCEPPKIIGNRIQEFDYKMVNALIQGSAADCTKESIVRYHDMRVNVSRFMLTVHDEQANSAQQRYWPEAMMAMKEAMESVEFDVPMLSEGTYSARNWSDLAEFDKHGKLVTKTKYIKDFTNHKSAWHHMLKP